jgi:hypothetical protein
MANYRVKIGSASLGLSTQVISIGWDAIIEWKKDSDSINYEFNPKGEWTINCASLPSAWGSDAPTIFQALLDEENSCEIFEVSAEVECAEVWEEVWAGEFSSRDWKSNRDKSTITVKPKEVSPFQCLKRNWKFDQNIYTIGSVSGLWVFVRPSFYVYESIQRISALIDITDPCPTPPFESSYCYYETEHFPDAVTGYCVYYYHRYVLPGTCSGSTPIEPDSFSDWNLLTDNCPTDSEWWTCPETARVPYNFVHGLRLQDVLEYLFDQTGCGLTVKSDFFDMNADASSPANSAYTAAAQYCQNLVIFQKSDVKRHDASDQALQPAFKMRLFDLLSDLKTMFNLEWTITDAGATFRLEHISYFEASPGNDYTSQKYKKELEQDKTDIPRFSRFVFRDEQATAYFKGSPIEIYCGEEEKEFKLSLFSTDIAFIVSDDAVESIGDDGFVLMSTLEDSGLLYNVNDNRPLSWTQLHENFHRYNMAGAGEINGAPTTPLSLKKTRKQPEFIVSHCCYDTFDPFDLVTVSLGDGQVQSAAWNIAKDYLEIDLKQ